MNDMTWMLIRYGMIAVGTWGATKGWFPPDSVGPIVDAIQQPLGGIIAGIGTIWGVIVNKGSVRVPTETALRKDVPTVSPVTGATIPGPQFTAATIKDHK